MNDDRDDEDGEDRTRVARAPLSAAWLRAPVPVLFFEGDERLDPTSLFGVRSTSHTVVIHGAGVVHPVTVIAPPPPAAQAPEETSRTPASTVIFGVVVGVAVFCAVTIPALLVLMP
jgi:hypothetical protein